MGGDDMAKTKYKIILSDNDIEMLNSILADDEPSDRITLSAKTVSYKHIDVYTRQAGWCDC